MRATAERHATYEPAQHYYVLFELAVEGAMLTEYVDGPSVRRRFTS